MVFADKLTFLLNITSTTNVQLAHGVRIDPSMVSKLRHGVRGAPKNIENMRSVARYFAKKCCGEYQRAALSETIGVSQATLEDEEMEEVIFKWLTAQDGNLEKRSQRTGFQTDGEGVAPWSIPQKLPGVQAKVKMIDTYFFNAGKRQAIRHLWQMAMQQNGGTVCVFTDENLKWFYEDPGFLDECMKMAHALADHGYDIRHISIAQGEMHSAVAATSFMVPAYMYGMFETYYYPRLRDNLHKRTLILIPGQAAVFSGSIGQQEEAGVVCLTTDRDLLSFMEQDFERVWRLCHPISEAYTIGSWCEQRLKAPRNDDTDFSDCMQVNSELSFVTVPLDLLEFIPAGDQRRSTTERIIALQSGSFEKRLEKQFRFVDIIHLSTLEEIVAGKVLMPFSYMGDGEALPYTPQAYRTHLRRIVALLKRYSNYMVIMAQDIGMQGMSMFVEKNVHALIIKRELPLRIFEIQEQNMAMCFWEYLATKTKPLRMKSATRQNSIQRLEEKIAQIDRYLESHGS